MHEVSLAFFWHQHQPYYLDDVAGTNSMPWVRLHGTKDYWGMAKLLDGFPEMRATINLVPSLLVQLAAYTDTGHEDRHLKVSRLPADGLSEEDMNYLLDNFFMVHPEHNIRPWPRYQELYEKRGFSVDSAQQAGKRFGRQEIRDLQCWSNLTWIHPLAFEQDAGLAAFRKKGRNWTEKEKHWLLDKQMELLREVVPLHRRLQARGQVELTTSPFHHPILPLLLDKRLARRAMPDVQLPDDLEGHVEDVREHVRRAVEYHEKIFGQKPRGMWPSEGSVCQEVIPAIAEAGVHWIATDEEILAFSTDGWVSRDAAGFLRNPEMLYRPWRVEQEGKPLEIVFRDHAMSDQIGFHYQRYAAEHAVDDFSGKLEAIGNATGGNAGHRPTLVTVILDGENCWEYYPKSGVDFLQAVYRRVLDHPKIEPVRIGDYLEQYPATDKLGHLFPGSWIQHNFGIWIGHPECNRAWDLVARTREHLAHESRIRPKSDASLARAWDELRIAQGSDWFWWFGDSHSSAQDRLFDQLFRKHLQNVYHLLGQQPPAELARPISHGHSPHSEPTGFLNVKVDGRRTYFEWLHAGHYACRGSRGTMAMAQEGLVEGLYFGFDRRKLYVRLDARDGTVRERMAEIDGLRVFFFQPEKFEIRLTHPTRRKPTAKLSHDGEPVVQSGVEAAAQSILELAIPLRSLGVKTGDPIHFCIELLRENESQERVPQEGAIETTVPSPDFELVMWQA